MDGCRFCALAESYLASPPWRTLPRKRFATRTSRRSWVIIACRSTTCSGAWSNATSAADKRDAGPGPQ